MRIEIKLVNRTDNGFARFLLPDKSTIEFHDPQEAYDALKMYFGMNEFGIEAYMNSERDESWEHTEYNPSFSHIS